MNNLELELSQKVEGLYWRRERADTGTPEYQDIDFDLRVANDDLDKVRQESCENHMARVYPEGGYDRCAECGSRF